MMNINSTIAIGLLLVMAASQAVAEDSVWKSQAELGIVNTSGNSRTSTVNAKVDATNERASWRHNFHAEMLRTSSANVTSSEKYQTSAQSDYKFNATDYAFGRINYENDKFSGFDYQATLSAGYGKRVINETEMTLDLEVGPGVRFYKDTVTQVSGHDPLIRLAVKYLWKVSGNATFTEDLSSDVGREVTISKSVTALQANINATLAMKISFTVKNTSEVPIGNKQTDTETAVTLVYSF